MQEESQRKESHVVPATITIEAYKAQRKWEEENERNIQHQLTVNKIKGILQNASVSSDSNYLENLAKRVIDNGEEIQSNVFPVTGDINNQVQSLAEDFHRRYDHVYFFASAPMESSEISLENDKKLRSYQIKNFKRIFVETTTKASKHHEFEAEVFSYDELLTKSFEFIEVLAEYSFASTIFFNGHGSLDGMRFDSKENIPPNNYINALKDKMALHNLRTTTLVFAQCYGFNFDSALQDAPTFCIRSLSTVQNPETFYTLIYDPEHIEVVDSEHIQMTEYAEEENKKDVRESRILPGSSLSDISPVGQSTSETIIPGSLEPDNRIMGRGPGTTTPGCSNQSISQPTRVIQQEQTPNVPLQATGQDTNTNTEEEGRQVTTSGNIQGRDISQRLEHGGNITESTNTDVSTHEHTIFDSISKPLLFGVIGLLMIAFVLK